MLSYEKHILFQIIDILELVNTKKFDQKKTFFFFF